MKAGMVVTIRVNPRNCMAILDLMKLIGVEANVQNYSFARLVSIGLSTILETMVRNGQLPDRTGFEYLNMVGPWENGKNSRSRYYMAEGINAQGASYRPPNYMAPPERKEYVEPPPPTFTKEQEKLLPRFKELCAKMDYCTDGVEGFFWQKEDTKEYREIHTALFPGGKLDCEMNIMLIHNVHPDRYGPYEPPTNV